MVPRARRRPARGVVVDDDDAFGRPDRLRHLQGGAVVGARDVDDVNHWRSGGQVEGGGFLGAGHARGPLVVGVGVGLAGEFLDAQEQRFGHDGGLLQVCAASDGHR